MYLVWYHFRWRDARRISVLFADIYLDWLRSRNCEGNNHRRTLNFGAIIALRTSVLTPSIRSHTFLHSTNKKPNPSQ